SRMSDQWMPTIRLPLTEEHFRRLPRNPAYLYGYLDGQAVLFPQARAYHAVLELSPPERRGDVDLRPLRAEDVPRLIPLFAAAFRTIQPFGSLADETRLEAARQCLDRTLRGTDGPWIERASFVAWGEINPIGAVWVTLVPDGEACDPQSYYW